MKIGVVGLGSMGFGMASSLLRGGHQVWGDDVNPAAVKRLQGTSVGLVDALPNLDALVVVVLKSAQVEAVLFGEKSYVAQLRKGTVVICCVTVAPEFARTMAARCEALGVQYLDAPISGGSVKAAAGKLSIMASGTDAAFAAAQSVLQSTAEKVFNLGDKAGMGSAMKAVNQMLAGTHIAAMAEAITFGITQGISPETFLKVIPDCAGTSWMLENRAPHIVDGDYAPRSAVDIWPKDLGIVLDAAGSAGFDAPLTTAALRQFQAASALGLGREDDAAVAKVYARASGLTLPGEG
jgi:putative dehydrogenase